MSEGDAGGRYTPEYLYGYREKLSGLEQKAAEAYDKVIVTLAGGALAITLTLVGQVFTERRHLWLMMLGWIGFTAAMFCTLLSLMTSREAMRRQIQIVDEISTKGGTFGDYKNAANTWTRGLNVAALCTFVLGVVMAVIFMGANLPRG